mmetsp:Transcript_46809/g.111451  ORF Transcript_46809/g.111451 Transcript_46809/m.111451 type:complete len:410 (-) Transcript_46809:1358-2587(-)
MGNENGYDDGGGANGNGNGVNGSANGHGTSTSFHGNGGNGKNTGKLSNHEYISEKEIENMKQQFQLLDADGSGTLDHEEFIQLGRKAGLPLDKLEQLILVVDKNHDGVISFSEFVSGDVIYEVRKLIGEQRALARKELLLKESRTHVNILKLLQVVRLKIENSKRAYEFGAYLIFLLVYCVAVLMQRAPFQSMMLSASLSNYFIGSAYRVPYANELKDFMGIRTTQEFWDWHQIHFLGLFYVQNYYNGDLYDRIDQGNILVHIRKTGGFRLVQRRAENGSCWSSKAYQQFQSDCYGYTYADGMVGPTDEKPFYGAMSKKRVQVRTAHVVRLRLLRDFRGEPDKGHDANAASPRRPLDRQRDAIYAARLRCLQPQHRPIRDRQPPMHLLGDGANHAVRQHLLQTIRILPD